MKRLLLTVSLSALCACSPTPSSPNNSTVVVGEYVLTPRSALFFNGSQHDVSSVIVLSDMPDICEYYRERRCSLFPAGQPPGRLVVISVGGPVQVGDSNASNGCFGYDTRCRNHTPLANAFGSLAKGSAQFVFASNASGSTNASTSFSATSGTVSLKTVSEREVTGSYSVTLDTGLSLNGTFNATACLGLELLADFVPRCTQTATDDGGTRTVCQCEGRNSVAQCGTGPGLRPLQSCSCRAFTGEESTCGNDYLCCPIGVMADGGR